MGEEDLAVVPGCHCNHRHESHLGREEDYLWSAFSVFCDQEAVTPTERFGAITSAAIRQHAGIRIRHGSRDQLRPGGNFHEAAVLHDGDAIAKMRDREIVADEDIGQFLPIAQIL